MRRMALVIFVVLAGLLAQATQAQTPNTINTIAGGGTNSGAATSAVLPRPASAVRDTAGNTFIAVPALDIVYKVTGGTITAYAGTGIAGFSGDGGPAAAAALNRTALMSARVRDRHVRIEARTPAGGHRG